MISGQGGPFRPLAPGQRSQISVIGIDGSDRTVVHTAPRLLEAPNWTPDGEWLIVNGGGRMFRIRADGIGGLQPIELDGIDAANNDHALSPDGATLYISARGVIYAAPVTGGTPRRVSPPQPEDRPLHYYLHGVSSDGTTLACTGIHPHDRTLSPAIYLLPAAGGPDTRLAAAVTAPDGPEFDPGGDFLYCNAEPVGAEPGHAQLFRMRLDGTEPKQLTCDPRVNWFPHPSPDGAWIAYLSYPPGVRGHPCDQPIALRLIPVSGGAPRDIVRLFGGQGTINVNSWAPDSRHLAYVAYPIAE